MSTLFVTVGSTKFDDLIQSILNSSDLLKKLKFRRVIIQTGKSQYDGQKLAADLTTNLDIEIYRYKNSILPDIKAADLVVSHAGAGTCLEVLRLNKKLLVVINETLMDNHQSELADQLANDNYLMKTNVRNFRDNLKMIMTREFNKFPSQKESKFEKIFDKFLQDE